MDDTKTQGLSQPNQYPPAQPFQPPLPNPLVSNPVREAEPIVNSVHSEPYSADAEPTLHPEVEKAGVEYHNKEIPNLTLEDTKAGLSLAKESVPLDVKNPSQIMPQAQAKQISEKGSSSDSLTALAILVFKQFKRMLYRKEMKDTEL